MTSVARRPSTKPLPRRPARAAAAPRAGASVRSARQPTFLGVPAHPGGDAAELDADVLLFGVELRATSRRRRGGAAVPAAVRAASLPPRPFSAALGVDFGEELVVVDGGDRVAGPRGASAALAELGERVEAHARCGVVVGLIGADRGVTLAGLRGVHRAKLRRLGLLRFGAQPGCAPPGAGIDASAGSVVRLAVEEGLVAREWVTEVGLRGPYATAHELAYARGAGFEVITTDDVRWDLHAAVTQVREVARRGPLYVAVDLPVLEPACAPGVAEPVPGGLTTWELQQLLRALVGADVVGFDVTGLVAERDLGGLTALAAVGVLQELLAAMAETRRSARPAPSSRRQRERRRSP